MCAALRLRQAFVQGGHAAAAGENQIDAGLGQRPSEACVHLHRLFAQFQHVAEDGNAATALADGGAAEHLEGGTHGCRVGVVAVVDEIEDALGQGDAVTLAAAFQGFQVGELRGCLHHVRAGRADRRENGERIPAGPYGTPFAMVEDGTWYLFYERGDAGSWLASSRDRKVWTNVQDEPVLKPGPGEYDKLMIALNQVIKYQGRYYALLHGTGSETLPRLWSTSVAVSDDLVHWTKFEGNPLFPIQDDRSSGVWVRDGETFRLYTMHDQVNLYLPRK